MNMYWRFYGSAHALGEHSIFSALQRCSESDLKLAAEILAYRGFEKAVTRLMNQFSETGSIPYLGSFLQVPVKHIDEAFELTENVLLHILIHFPKDRLRTFLSGKVLSKLVEEGMRWEKYGMALWRCLFDRILQNGGVDLQQQIVTEVLDTVDDRSIAVMILPCFSHLCLDHMLEKAVAKGKWDLVLQIMYQIIRITLAQWAKGDKCTQDTQFWNVVSNSRGLHANSQIMHILGRTAYTDKKDELRSICPLQKALVDTSTVTTLPLLPRHRPPGMLQTEPNCARRQRVFVDGTEPVCLVAFRDRDKDSPPKHWTHLLCEVLFIATLSCVKDGWFYTQEADGQTDQSFQNAASKLATKILKLVASAKRKSNKNTDTTLGKLCCRIPSFVSRCSRFKTFTDPLFSLVFIQQLIPQFFEQFQSDEDGLFVLVVLACIPVAPALQEAAILMLHKHSESADSIFDMRNCVVPTMVLPHWRSDIFRNVCLLNVPEHVRRLLFYTAVKQKHWELVKQWGDHALYDDQRLWALEEAYTDKQWGVMVLLSDHGLTATQVMHTYLRLALHAPWDIVLELRERGADMEIIKSGLLNRLSKKTGQKIQAEDRKALQNQPKFSNVSKMEASDVLTPEEKERIRTTLNCADLAELRDILQRVCEVLEEVSHSVKEAGTLKTAVRQGKWEAVFHSLRHNPDPRHIHPAVQAAVAQGAWLVLVHLLRFGLQAEQRDELFLKMVRKRQWAVCRSLLEQGISVEVCQEVSTTLTENRQWTLVAQVLSQDLDSSIVQNLVDTAMKRKEGSVVWQYTEYLKRKSLVLPASTRESLLHEAFVRDNWQAVKALLKEMSGNLATATNCSASASLAVQSSHYSEAHCSPRISVGTEFVDMVFLDAIEQQVWDVVDICQNLKADINVRNLDGDTPIHRAAMGKRWETVEELVKRGAYPSPLDSEGFSVLHRAISSRQWDTVKLLIQFHADIHQPGYTFDDDRVSVFKPLKVPESLVLNNLVYADTKIKTPLQMLIEHNQGSLIETTLYWFSDQKAGLSDEGETTLHAVCLDGWPNTLFYLIARGVNPLAVTKRGHTALTYAVMTGGSSRKMVAECIRLGFSTHQAFITDTVLQHPYEASTASIASFSFGMDFADQNTGWDSYQKLQRPSVKYRLKEVERKQRILNCYFRFCIRWSPLLLSVIMGLPEVTRMLFESGSCSFRELFTLQPVLEQLQHYAEESSFDIDIDLLFYWDLYSDFSKKRPWKYRYFKHRCDDWSPGLVREAARYLLRVSVSPRSLKSMCRLVISGCLDVRSKHRHSNVAELDLEEDLQSYVLFSDLIDPVLEGCRDVQFSTENIMADSEKRVEWGKLLDEYFKHLRLQYVASRSSDEDT